MQPYPTRGPRPHDVDDLVIRNLREQIAAFDQVRPDMRASLDRMTPDEPEANSRLALREI
jgi:hypothetical protein